MRTYIIYQLVRDFFCRPRRQKGFVAGPLMYLIFGLMIAAAVLAFTGKLPEIIKFVSTFTIGVSDKLG